MESGGESRKALAYYERIYISYGKYRDLVVQAYLKRGGILEDLQLDAEAREVYDEMVGRSDLSAFEEVKIASRKLDALGGPLPEPITTEEAGL